MGSSTRSSARRRSSRRGSKAPRPRSSTRSLSRHRYLDGNGRIGRLLVTLLLEHWKVRTKPLLYLSLFFERHRDEYFRRLNAVRVDGDWEGWLEFFLDGVATIADEAVASARELFALVAEDRARVLASEKVYVAAAPVDARKSWSATEIREWFSALDGTLQCAGETRTTNEVAVEQEGRASGRGSSRAE